MLFNMLSVIMLRTVILNFIGTNVIGSGKLANYTTARMIWQGYLGAWI
jgi:hypothetical protein